MRDTVHAANVEAQSFANERRTLHSGLFASVGKRETVYARFASKARLMSIRRVVLDINSKRFPESRDFYVGLLGFELAMDMGWVMTFVSPTNPTAQLSVMRRDATAAVDPDASIEVSDVDSVYIKAQQRGDFIVYPLTDEPWGVRRFFVRDPNGKVINVLSHVEN